MVRFVLIVVVAAPWASGENLLANPGFEQLRGGMPAHWNLFVAPMEGAHGKLDASPARDGAYCAMLHNPRPYEREPLNNWSQSVIEDLGGSTVTLSGDIRTRDATEAALWVQCWTQTPARVITFASTGAETPRYGTTPWTRVSTTVEVPEGTDFLMVRCVLKGHGTAWFDSVTLDAEPADATEGLAALEPGEAAESAGEPRTVSEAERRVPMTTTEELAEAQRKLARAQAALDETQAGLRAASAEMRDRVVALQAQVEALRAELRAVREVARPERPTPPTPPLVPYVPQREAP
jgi:hypothetical protein